MPRREAPAFPCPLCHRPAILYKSKNQRRPDTLRADCLLCRGTLSPCSFGVSGLDWDLQL